MILVGLVTITVLTVPHFRRKLTMPGARRSAGSSPPRAQRAVKS